jgi:alpha-1,6-mannosyltransferase
MLTARRVVAPARLAALVGSALTAIVLFRGPKGSLGPNLLLLLGAYVALAVVLVVELGRHRRGLASSLGKVVVVACTAVLLLLAVIRPPAESHDVWAYAWYGRVVAHYHASPYKHAPAAYPNDKWARHVDRIWSKDKSVYGPVFTVVSGAGMLVFGFSFLAARLFFQAVAALCVAGAIALVWRRTRSPAAVAALGLNPLVIVSVVNGAHNDAWVGLAVLGGVVLVTEGRLKWAGLVFAAAVMVKVAAALPLAAVGLWVWRNKGFRPMVAMGATAAAAGVVGFAAAGGTAAIEPLQNAQLHISGASVWYGPRRWLTFSGLRRRLGSSGASHLVRQRISAAATAAVVGLTLLLSARRLDHADPALVAGAAVLAYTLLGAYVLPWYVFWGLPALLVAWRSRLTWLALLHGAVLHLAYVPDPLLHGQKLPKLFMLSPLQRLQLDLFQVWVPIVEVGIIIAVVLISLSGLRRRSTSGVTRTGPDRSE